MKHLPPSYRHCLRSACGFRYSQPPGQSLDLCPKCGSPTRLIPVPPPPHRFKRKFKPESGVELEVLLDNIRSALNVGAMFRVADGAGVRHIHLAGITPTPDNPKVAKTALGAENAVPWTQHWNGLEAVQRAKEKGMTAAVLENCSAAINLFDSDYQIGNTPIFLVVGNEVNGVDPHIRTECEMALTIPMYGIKSSLNVATAFAVAVYHLRHRVSHSPLRKVNG